VRSSGSPRSTSAHGEVVLHGKTSIDAHIDVASQSIGRCPKAVPTRYPELSFVLIAGPTARVDLGCPLTELPFDDGAAGATM
jgi:hypothetical protein